MCNIKDLDDLLRSNIKLKFCFLLFFSFLFFSSLSNAADITKQVILTTGIERDSNPNLSPNATNPVTTYSLIPQILLGVDDGINLLSLDASLFYQRQSNQKVLVDREDPRVALGWDRLYGAGKYGIRFNFFQASAIIAELRSAGEFQNIDNTQRIKTLSGNWLHNFNDRWSNLIDASYSDVLFTAPGQFQNFRVSELKSKLNYEYSDKLNTSILAGYAHLRPERIFNATDLFRAGLGADYLVSDALTLSARAGVYDLGGRQTSNDWEALFKADLNSGKSLYSAELKRELIVSGLGGFQKFDIFGLKWTYTKSAFDRLGVDYGYSEAKADRQVGLNTLEFQQIGAFYEYNFTDKWRSRVYGSFREQEANIGNSHGNLIGVSLTYDTLSF